MNYPLSFPDIMKMIEQKQVESFKNNLKVIMSRKSYISTFLGTFLGKQYFLLEEISYLANADFNKHCHKVIDSIGLLEEEAEFFHRMVNIVDVNHFVQSCLVEYYCIKSLDECQLGSGILQCLEASNNIIIES